MAERSGTQQWDQARWITLVGPNTVSRQSAGGDTDQVGAAKRVRDGNGEAALLLLWRAVLRRKAPSTVTNGEEQGAVGTEGNSGRWLWRLPTDCSGGGLGGSGQGAACGGLHVPYYLEHLHAV